MSIEIENAKTLMEKVDAVGNLIHQMSLAKTVGDDTRFKYAFTLADKLNSEALDIIDCAGSAVADLVQEEDDGEPDY